MTPASWTAVTVRNATDRDAIVRALVECGAEGVQELDTELVTHMNGPDVAAISRAV